MVEGIYYVGKPMKRLNTSHRLAILLHGHLKSPFGKTGIGVLRHSSNPIVSVIDRDYAGQSLSELTGIDRDIPIVKSVSDALVTNPDVLVIGVATVGGTLPSDMWDEIEQALAARVSIVNGLHIKMSESRDFSRYLGEETWIWDVRYDYSHTKEENSSNLYKLPGIRILTVGTDMSVGKMTTSLSLHEASQNRNLTSKFLATGQTSLMLGYDGLPVDALPLGESVSLVQGLIAEHAQKNDVLHVEGQGSLLHPGSTASLVLLRGAQPTHLILVHESQRTHVLDLPNVIIPPLQQVISLYEAISSVGTPFPIPVVGIALNTSTLNVEDSKQQIQEIERSTGLPCTDPIRFNNANYLLESIL